MAAKLEEGYFRGAVRIASLDESFVPMNSHTLELLKERHPPPHPNYQSPPEPVLNNSNSIEVSTFEVLAVICSFPKGSTSGPDGLIVSL